MDKSEKILKEPDTEVKGVLDDAFAKYRHGEKKYGPININTDRRDFLDEAEAELLDAIVYQSFEVLRIRRLNAALKGALNLSISAQEPKPGDKPEESMI